MSRRPAGTADRERAHGGGDPRRALPGVDTLLAREEVRRWEARWGRAAVRRALRGALAAERRRLGEAGARPADADALVVAAERALMAAGRPVLRSVLNATGVVLHTNLGRAPLAAEALEALALAGGYANLEYELESGGRGSRQAACAALLAELTGAEAAAVVNNNAAAVALTVNAFAAGREVVVSRGELVEIGGSFRIPDIVARSGARLVEVGTTNRTRPDDYRRAIRPETGLLLKVHPSNYRLQGFTEETSLAALVELGRETGVRVAHDLGSGLLDRALLPDFPAEPAARDAVAAGADVVTFSGDKLLGGPQAGLLAGRRDALAALRENPLARAFRVDKLTLAALEATLRLHRDPERATRRIPALRMLREPAARVEARARRALESHPPPPPARAEVARTEAVVGGGAFPGLRLPSAAWSVAGLPPERLEAACRAEDPPLIGRIAEGRLWLDFRTLAPGAEEREAAAVLARAVDRLA